MMAHLMNRLVMHILRRCRRRGVPVIHGTRRITHQLSQGIVRQMGKQAYSHRRIQAQGLIDHSAQILHVADVIIRRPTRRSNNAQYLLTESAEDVRMLRQTIDCERQRARRGITPGKEDVQNLVVDDLAIYGVRNTQGKLLTFRSPSQ